MESAHGRPQEPAITVVVCSRNRVEHLTEALPAVVATLGPSDRLVLVDSASRNGGYEDLASRSGAEYVRVEKPGLSRARNAGIRAAATDVIAFTDDDCRPRAGWLDAIRAHFRQSDVAFVTGSTHASSSEGPQASTLDREAVVRYDAPADPFGMGHGANMAFRRATLVEVGPFDEELGAGAPLRSGEDADMLYRCLEAGWRGVYEPDAAVVHEQWRDRSEYLALRWGYGLGTGAYRVKVVKRSPARGARLLATSMWRQVTLPVLRALRRRDAFGLAGALAWTGGMCVGAVVAALRPTERSTFRPR